MIHGNPEMYPLLFGCYSILQEQSHPEIRSLSIIFKYPVHNGVYTKNGNIISHMDGFRGTPKSLRECEVIMNTSLYSKVRSPPYFKCRSFGSAPAPQ